MSLCVHKTLEGCAVMALAPYLRPVVGAESHQAENKTCDPSSGNDLLVTEEHCQLDVSQNVSAHTHACTHGWGHSAVCFMHLQFLCFIPAGGYFCKALHYNFALGEKSTYLQMEFVNDKIGGAYEGDSNFCFR